MVIAKLISFLFAFMYTSKTELDHVTYHQRNSDKIQFRNIRDKVSHQNFT